MVTVNLEPGPDSSPFAREQSLFPSKSHEPLESVSDAATGNSGYLGDTRSSPSGRLGNHDGKRGVPRFTRHSKVRTGRFGDWFLGKVGWGELSQISQQSNSAMTQTSI